MTMYSRSGSGGCEAFQGSAGIEGTKTAGDSVRAFATTVSVDPGAGPITEAQHRSEMRLRL
jgi:hypothetical protein